MKKTVKGRKSWKVKHYEHSREFDLKHKGQAVLDASEEDGRPENMGLLLAGSSSIPMFLVSDRLYSVYGRKTPRMSGCE